MKKKIISFILVAIAISLSLIAANSTEVLAEENVTYISLSDEGVKVDEDEISTDATSNVYVTNKINNGSSGQEALEANVDITNIININKSGVYEFTGSLSDGQIAINANTIDGDVTIILNNANITCENAPAVFVYNTNEKLLDKTLTIKTINGTTNSLTGARIKESVLNWEKQEEIIYYVEKGYEEDNTYYEEYKYNGAISSDISLIFEGEGTLKITSTKKEGIETRGDVTFNSGKYIIKAEDDGINACTDKESVITINGGEVLIDVSNAEEGDGIDSNGYLYINGGTVCAFASEISQDSGIDADLGIYINGGNVVATGSMSDRVSSESKQEYLQLQFSNEVQEGSLLTITDENKKPLVAFDTDTTYKTLTISSQKLTGQEYSIYEGGNIEGTESNGLYTEISSYEGGTVREDWNNASDRGFNSMMNKDFEKINQEQKESNNYIVYYYVLIALVVLLVICVAITIVTKKKGKILTFIIGMLVGAIMTTTGFIIYNKVNEHKASEQITMDVEQMMDMRGNRGNMPEGEMPEGMEMPTGERPSGNMQEPPTTEENNLNL